MNWPFVTVMIGWPGVWHQENPSTIRASLVTRIALWYEPSNAIMGGVSVWLCVTAAGRPQLAIRSLIRGMFAVLSLLAQPDTRADILGFAGEDILSLSPWIGQCADGGAFWVHQD